MINYWIAGILVITLIVFQKYWKETLETRVIASLTVYRFRRDIGGMKRVLWTTRLLLVAIWGAMFYIVACFLYFLSSFF